MKQSVDSKMFLKVLSLFVFISLSVNCSKQNALAKNTHDLSLNNALMDSNTRGTSSSSIDSLTIVMDNTVIGDIKAKKGSDIQIGGANVSNTQASSLDINISTVILGSVKATGEKTKVKISEVGIQGLKSNTANISTNTTIHGGVKASGGQSISVGTIQIGNPIQNTPANRGIKNDDPTYLRGMNGAVVNPATELNGKPHGVPIVLPDNFMSKRNVDFTIPFPGNAVGGGSNLANPDSHWERGFELFRLADCAYEECIGSMPLNWSKLSSSELKKLGLDPEFLDQEWSGFSATIYKNEETEEYVVAFRGTEDSTDIVVDALELGGGSPQHVSAIILADFLNTKLPDSKLTYVGHSLGGGLATAAALKSGKPAVTFNSAGISNGTAKKHNLNKKDAEKLVTSYRVEGDPVSAVPFGHGALGSQHELEAPHPFDWKDPDTYTKTEHGRDSIYDAFAKIGLTQ